MVKATATARSFVPASGDGFLPPIARMTRMVKATATARSFVPANGWRLFLRLVVTPSAVAARLPLAIPNLYFVAKYFAE